MIVLHIVNKIAENLSEKKEHCLLFVLCVVSLSLLHGFSSVNAKNCWFGLRLYSVDFQLITNKNVRFIVVDLAVFERRERFSF